MRETSIEGDVGAERAQNTLIIIVMQFLHERASPHMEMKGYYIDFITDNCFLGISEFFL